MSKDRCEGCGTSRDVHWSDGAQVDLCGSCLKSLCIEEKELERGIAGLLNRYGVDNTCGRPDFILAEYVMDCLRTWWKTHTKYDAWYRGELEQSAPKVIELYQTQK